MKTLSLLLLGTVACSAQRYATDTQLANEAAVRAAADSGKAGTSGEGVTASAFRTALGLGGGQSPTWAGILNTPISGGTGSFTTLAAGGNTTLGASSANTITFTGRIASHVTPSSNNAYDLGTTGLRFKDAWLSGAVASATLGVSGASSLAGGITTPAATNLNITPGTTGFVDIMKPSQTGVRETVLRAKVSDGGNDAFAIYNGTIGDDRFVPAFGGAQFSTSASPAIIFKAVTDAANDTLTAPLMQFEAARTSSLVDPFNGTLSSIATRSLFRWLNGSVTVGEVSKDGQWALPSVSVSGTSTLGTTSVTSATFPPLESTRSTTSTTGIFGAMRLAISSTGDMTDGLGAQISFSGSDNGGSGFSWGAIGATRAGADNTGDLFFSTSSVGTAAEAMRVKANGNVLVGSATDAGTGKLQVSGAVAMTGGLRRGTTTFAARPSASSNPDLELIFTDALSPAVGSAVAGGGTKRVVAISNGTNYIITAIIIP
ncbi:hypothetical protein JIN84_06020 [Luteolibacter yonseiensis]|uniref:Uncharacterized protein n=1 Tax=Luteolibacter yonseiensis TaxID=1144680 RepID=A0A934R1N6_9BACT|nr:hypothetical protein [Luteolibacter yonseiensis]MBK1815159.1 hypothetical protein [Luteolibacter yonseiensis]